jgi:hypothetical protein
MDGDTFLERVRADNRTELDRLASEKAVLAATDARLDTPTVLGVLAATERRLGTVFEGWASETEDERARAAFESAGREADGHVADLLADVDLTPDQEPDVATVEDLEGTVARVAGGFVGQSLVLDGLMLQGINVFVNEAESALADRVRAVRTDVSDRRADGVALLAELCAGDEEWETAERAVTAVVEGAYDEYVSRLDALGMDPKSVC